MTSFCLLRVRSERPAPLPSGRPGPAPPRPTMAASHVPPCLLAVLGRLRPQPELRMVGCSAVAKATAPPSAPIGREARGGSDWRRPGGGGTGARPLTEMASSCSGGAPARGEGAAARPWQRRECLFAGSSAEAPQAGGGLRGEQPPPGRAAPRRLPRCRREPRAAGSASGRGAGRRRPRHCCRQKAGPAASPAGCCRAARNSWLTEHRSSRGEVNPLEPGWGIPCVSG